jgi:nitrous oxidase accessory protein
MRYFLTILILVLAAPAMAKIIRVGKQQAFTSIQKAIDASANGDMVLVEAGTYKERGIVISRSIYLKGISFPVLDGEKKYEVIAVKASNVTVEGFKIVHSGNSSIQDIAGIKIYNSSNVVIRGNILDDTFFGIYTQQGSNCTVEKNEITSYGKEELQSGNGIHCWKSDSMRIIGNNITGHRDGIYFEFVTNSMVWRNNSHKNIRYGLHFMFSHNDSYVTNIFANNGAGVAVMYSHGVKMFHNFFEENWGDAAYGLLLKEISDSYIDGNYFTRNTSGIYMEGASRIHIQKNLFKSNGWGMKIQASCMDITVEHNNFIANTFDVGTNGELVLNTFNNNYWDKYEGYDLNKDKLGDIPFRPVSMYSMIIEKNPPAMMLFRSFITTLLDKTEKLLPSLTPEGLKDVHPLMKALPL